VEDNMADAIYIVTLFAFFALAALFVKGCDRLIGSDAEALAQGVPGTSESADESRAA
jgi:hypothetical protein